MSFRISGRSLTELARALKHPLVLLTSILVVAIAGAVWLQLATEQEARKREDTQEVARVALMLEQNVFRIASELDRIIHFVRMSRDSSGGAVDWQTLISNRYAIHDQVAQVAIIDADGRLIASTAMPKPDKVVDLSDREHFRFHTYSSVDQLYISRPVLGRASGKWTIQFTRRFDIEDGSFGGVIVVSMDPAVFASTYGNVDLGDNGGVAVLGSDERIIAGTGFFSTSFNTIHPPFTGNDRISLLNGTAVSHATGSNGTRALASRPVRGFPLSVAVQRQSSAENATWRSHIQRYWIVVGLSSLVLLGGALIAAVSLQRREIQVSFMASHDALTGLANRRSFGAELGRMRAARQTQPFALHLLDLDGFKAVNDTFGHPVGDKLLIAVAQRLRENLRSTDTLARLGGDEFAILQAGIPMREQAEALAARLCDLLAKPFVIDGQPLLIGTSVGIVTVDAATPASLELMIAADLALYVAKSQGKGCHVVYADEMNATAQARRKLESDLRQAIAKEQFVLHYQPIVHIETKAVAGYEALVRWRHPERGMLPPGDFICLAEQTGLIVPIGHWVLNTACREMAKRPSDAKIAVNISPVQVRHGGLAEVIRDALEHSGLDAARLEIEITESVLMQADNNTLTTLRDIAALGVQIAMDDFGTGYSSLSYLQNYPISCIKIDRSFVRNLESDDKSASIVRAIATLAQCMGMSTVAEGVETAKQLSALALLGCTEAQGYFFSPPKAAREILPPEAKAAAEAMEVERDLAA